MSTVFDHLLTEEPGAPTASMNEAWQRCRAVSERFPDSVDAAVAGGFVADRLGYAFLAGYQAAIVALLPDLPRDRAYSLAATEEGGGHPAAIRTVLSERDGVWTVRGTKTFTTLAGLADRLVVVASRGTGPDGRNRLAAALVDVTEPAVTVADRPALAFAPEIPHAVVTFDDARAWPLPGDGYTDLLKPFRTIEDIHVTAAALGWLVRVGRQADWPRPVLQRLLGIVAALRGLGGCRPSSSGVHVALAGIFDDAERLFGEIEPLWARVEEQTRARWERDRPLLGVAGRARDLRLATAWRAVGTGDRG
ncbi:acyl-CoA dehydrogenase family protein [Nocardia shimofusensis]|uniref:acyl-CoA dehydrogenase family protein n=1 Tax=Nocardia shimofusensis TaxID=228596 RepID=UPI00082C0ADE|nr:acyl-CoA dehydrogenase family protein [Nocardia shimofusensis]